MGAARRVRIAHARLAIDGAQCAPYVLVIYFIPCARCARGIGLKRRSPVSGKSDALFFGTGLQQFDAKGAAGCSQSAVKRCDRNGKPARKFEINNVVSLKVIAQAEFDHIRCVQF